MAADFNAAFVNQANLVLLQVRPPALRCISAM